RASQWRPTAGQSKPPRIPPHAEKKPKRCGTNSARRSALPKHLGSKRSSTPATLVRFFATGSRWLTSYCRRSEARNVAAADPDQASSKQPSARFQVEYGRKGSVPVRLLSNEDLQHFPAS